MSLKFDRIQPWTALLAALDQVKKSFIREYSKCMYFDDLLSGELSLPFGLLVYKELTKIIFIYSFDHDQIHKQVH